MIDLKEKELRFFTVNRDNFHVGFIDKPSKTWRVYFTWEQKKYHRSSFESIVELIEERFEDKVNVKYLGE